MPLTLQITLKLVLLATLIVCSPVSVRADAKPDLTGFNQRIKPLLQKYCVQCHRGKTPKAKIGLDRIDLPLLCSDLRIVGELQRQRRIHVVDHPVE